MNKNESDWPEKNSLDKCLINGENLSISSGEWSKFSKEFENEKQMLLH